MMIRKTQAQTLCTKKVTSLGEQDQGLQQV